MAPKQGFSLLEVMVAMAVLGLAGIALTHLAGENTRSAGVVEQRTLAGIVAGNRAVAVAVGPRVASGELRGQERQAGRLWDWTQTAAPAGERGLARVDIAVREACGNQVLARLSVLK